MKQLATETRYLLNRVIFGFLFVPGILWGFNELLARYNTGSNTLSIIEYYTQFYSRLDSPVTWLWVASPYLIFLLTRTRSKAEKTQSSLRDAVSKGRDETVKSLIAEGTDVHAINVRGQTPLHLAAMTDNVDVVRMLINGGADIDVADPGNNIRPLHNAATNGCANVCEFLLKQGADMDAQTASGDTALHLAATNKHFDVVSLLLSFHANHSIENNAGVTAEQIATARDDTAITNLIRQQRNNEWQYPRMASRKAS
jgi:hypothetical protein